MDILVKGKINCLLNVGPILENVVDASKRLSSSGILNSVYDLRHIRPFDAKKLKEIFKKYKQIFIIEEHYKDVGVYSSILQWANSCGMETKKLHSIGIENKFIKFTGPQDIARKKVGLDSNSIFKFVKKIDDKVGFDFDNTIINYDDLFYKISKEKGLITNKVGKSKESIKNYLIKNYPINIWQKIQSEVYSQKNLFS